MTPSKESLDAVDALFASARERIVRNNLKRVGKYGLRKDKSRTELAKHANAGPLLNATAEAMNESLAYGTKDHKPKVDQAQPVGYYLASRPQHRTIKWQDLLIEADKQSKRQGRAVEIYAARADGSTYVHLSILHRGHQG